jgi:hypothetical protein
MRRYAIAVAYCAVCGAALACAPKQRPASGPATDPANPPAGAQAAAGAEEATGSAELEVVNESNFDVRVFVIRAGQFTRLGLVRSMNTTSFELGPHLIDREIRLYADPVGSTTRQRTEAIYVRPGQQVRFGLERRMRSYSLAIY